MSDSSSEDSDEDSLVQAVNDGNLAYAHELLEDRDLDLNTQFQVACRKRHLEVARLLVKHGADVNVKESFLGNTALHWASREGQLEVAKMLAENGANPNAENRCGETPLHKACRWGNLEVARLLITYAADVGSTKQNGWTPLHLAYRWDQWAIIKLLTENGADINTIKGGKSQLEFELRFDINIFDKLDRANDSDVSISFFDCEHWDFEAFKFGIGFGWTPLHWTCNEGHLDLLAQLLIENGGANNINAHDKFGWTPLHRACWKGRLEVAKLLIANGSNPNAKDNKVGWTPFYRACWRCHFEVAMLLIQHGVDVNAKNNDGTTALFWACSKCDLSLPVHRWPLPRPINYSTRTMINTFFKRANALKTKIAASNWSGSERDRLKIAKFLIKNGANVNAKNNDGWTPLHRALYHGYSEIVKLLVESGADINGRDNDGTTPLLCALYRGDLETAKLLVENGAEINARDNKGWTALYRALYYDGNLETVELLVENGADVNFGDPALIRACVYGPVELAKWLIEKYSHHVVKGTFDIIKFLIECGTDFNVQQDDGWTLIRQACEDGNLEIFNLLVENGSNLSIKRDDGKTPLHGAIEVGLLGRVPQEIASRKTDHSIRIPYVEIVKSLIKNGADSSIHITIGLMKYSSTLAGDYCDLKRDYSWVYTLLLKVCEGIESYWGNESEIGENESGGDELPRQASRKDYELALELMKKVGDNGFNSRYDRYRCTPLHWACIDDHLDVVQVLLENGADVHAKDEYGMTPLHWPCYLGFVESAQLLMNHGANVNEESNQGISPLHVACKENRLDLVFFLLREYHHCLNVA